MNAVISPATVEDAAVLMIPLNKLKPSPKNARKTPHAPSDIEALAASIGEKGVLQPLVVEPECDPEGSRTGFFLVTIGEGRRKAQRLRASRKKIKKTHAVRCVVDITNDAHEISLDENVTRFSMHPADEFEAFQRLAQERGYGPEEIGARFGKTANVVRQRLKLAAVSPALMQGYREGDLTLEQLMAFTLTDDHKRQGEVWEQVGERAQPSMIRRLLTEDKVRASDRRAVFVGAEAYEAAGGQIERDLFTEDGGGYFSDPGLLDRLVLAKLEVEVEVVLAEGWCWVEPAFDYTAMHGLQRLYPEARALSPEDQSHLNDLEQAFEAIESEFIDEDDIPEDASFKLGEISQEIDRLNQLGVVYDLADKARSGVFVMLGRDGELRRECGFVRQGDGADAGGGDHRPANEVPDKTGATPEPVTAPNSRPTLSDRLVADLTTHRTAALQNALAEKPETALLALLHQLVLNVFSVEYAYETNIVGVKAAPVDLGASAEDVWESRAGREIAARHAAWAERLGSPPDDVWSALDALDPQERFALLAHCVSRTVDTVELGGRRPNVDATAKSLAATLDLDMTTYWTVTADTYLNRVTKALIVEAVTEGVSARAASKIDHLTKPEMAKAAERLLAGTGWLPPILRSLTHEPLPDGERSPRMAAE